MRAVGALLVLATLAPAKLLAGGAPPDADCQAALNVVVTESQQLNFGSVLADAFGGTVTVTYKNARSTTGPVLLPSTFSNGIMIFTTDVPPTGPIDCSKNTPTVSLTGGTLSRIGGGGSVITLNNMIFSTKATTPNSKFAAGSFYIGGDLVIPASPVAGSYTGSYTIDITFP